MLWNNAGALLALSPPIQNCTTCQSSHTHQVPDTGSPLQAAWCFACSFYKHGWWPGCWGGHGLYRQARHRSCGEPRCLVLWIEWVQHKIKICGVLHGVANLLENHLWLVVRDTTELVLEEGVENMGTKSERDVLQHFVQLLGKDI